MKRFHNDHALLISFIVLVLDQLTKYFFWTSFTLGQSIRIIPPILHFTLVYNQGAGFGILQGGRIFFIVFSFVVLAGIIWKWKEIEKRAVVPLGLIVGGIIGNLIDRMIHGYVIDFIDFRVWPVFNVADSAITVGAIILILMLWKK